MDIDPGPAKLNEISYVTIAQQGNTVDFGDFTSRDSHSRQCQFSTRGIAFGGNTPS